MRTKNLFEGERDETEAQLHKKCMRWLKGQRDKLGVYATKHEPGAGEPDHIIRGEAIAPACAFIELKTVKGQVRALQKLCHKRLQAEGYDVYICRTLDDYKAAVKQIVKDHGQKR